MDNISNEKCSVCRAKHKVGVPFFITLGGSILMAILVIIVLLFNPYIPVSVIFVTTALYFAFICSPIYIIAYKIEVVLAAVSIVGKALIWILMTLLLLFYPVAIHFFYYSPWLADH